MRLSIWQYLRAGGGQHEGAAQEREVCPVCQEPLGMELAMLPCGHQLCVRCQMALVERIPSSTPAVSVPSPLSSSMIQSILRPL